MKKINELKSERSDLILKMEAISVAETLTEEQRSEWTGYDTQIKAIDEDIKLAERQEELNKNKISKMENTTPINQSLVESFRSFLQGGYKTNEKFEVRANPILTSTDTGIINKTVNPAGIDVLYSPGEAFLRQLGVTFFTGLNGNFTLPSMAEHGAYFVNEAADGSTADMASASVTLVPRRITHSQAITAETLAQTSTNVYATILQDLVNGIGNAVVRDVFQQAKADSAGQVKAIPYTKLIATYGDFVDQEASINGLILAKPAYVTTPFAKSYMKQTAGLTNQVQMWKDNELNGYPAYSVPQLASGTVLFGDMSKLAVGQWGNLDVIVDPYSLAASGQIKVTVSGLYDSGAINKRAFCFFDSSIR